MKVHELETQFSEVKDELADLEVRSGSPLRICVLGFNNDVGGTRTAYREFLSMLLASGFTTAAISVANQKQWVPEGLAFHHRINFAKPKIGITKGLQVICAIIAARAFRPNVFVSIGMGRVGNSIARHLRQSTFTICQDVIHGRNPSDRAIVEALRSFKAIAPQAPSMESKLRSNGVVAENVRWLPCFPNLPKCLTLATPGRHRPFRIGYFGRIAPHKGIDLLIEAYAAESLAGRVIIEIWGIGETEAHKSRVQILGLDDSIRFMGAYPPDAAGTELMASYDCLALTTVANEGLPLILLEAMSCGLPLLVTNVAAIPDCCAENPDAVMVPPSIAGIRVGLREVLSRLENGAFVAARQRAYFDSRFSHSAMKRRWLDCLHDPKGFFDR